MGKVVLKDASLTVNGVDLSDHVASVEYSDSVEIVDMTAMGATGKGKAPGLRDGKITVTFLQDWAASKVDATLWPLYSAGTGATVVVKPTSATVSGTNPSYTGFCYISDYTPITGDVGSRAEAPVTFEVDGVVTRATA